jgi:5'-methylthioadenosine nucleosidase
MAVAPGRPLVLIAMEAEAAPVREALGIVGGGDQLHPGFPARLWWGEGCAVAINGVDERFGVDSIGSAPALTTAMHAIAAVDPSIVISAGTAGGFASRGGSIAKPYMANRCVFHDRRINLPRFDAYGQGDYAVADLSGIARELRLEQGTVSSGGALDAPPEDVARMNATGAVAKDMEAAAIAWLCERLRNPFGALKVITDLVDAPEEPGEQFLRNLASATATLADLIPALVDALGGVQLSSIPSPDD